VLPVYSLKHIPHSEWRNHDITQEIYDNLARKPYCSDGKDAYGNLYCEAKTKSQAIKRQLIQPNPPHKKCYIVIDLDTSDAIHTTLKESGAPPPHLIIQNPKNCHAHLVYKLAAPVYTWGNAHTHPMNYLAKIQKGLRHVLGGDAGYSGNLMKNPASADWTTYSVTTAPKEGYTLNYLEQELLLLVNFTDVHNNKRVLKPANDEGFGRNCTVFNKTRHIAYSLNGSYSELLPQILKIAHEFNINLENQEPLFHNEVNHIAKSIAKYCAKNDFTASHKAFSELQRHRITQRWGDSTDKKIQAQIWASEGMKIGLIAQQLGVTRQTLNRWGLRRNKK